ncbi:hypothetical protein ANCCAN_21023 [Ancylostoma caninum]|uniref:Uncharacterized protein n=1 Tax=Ancylostoma caninum TaxID=29170 RepID=A0A368FSF3_ANCCA|nr:hypothetical protein ANCCAN_21023 [Ancylostoma caninum]
MQHDLGMLLASYLFEEEDAEPVSNDGPTTQKRIVATYSAMEDVMATRTTFLTSIAAEGHAEEGIWTIWTTELKLVPLSRQWDTTNENEIANSLRTI